MNDETRTHIESQQHRLSTRCIKPASSGPWSRCAVAKRPLSLTFRPVFGLTQVTALNKANEGPYSGLPQCHMTSRSEIKKLNATNTPRKSNPIPRNSKSAWAS